MATQPAKGTRSASKRTATRAASRTKRENLKIKTILSLAEERGLLSGPRTVVVRARMPEELVEQAKRRSGITSDSRLLEAALANIAVEEDGYWAWMRKHRGTISQELDLEF